MTLQEIEASTKDMLTPNDVYGVIGCDPQALRIVAQQDPEALGFAVVVIGTRVRIPRLAFLHYLQYGRSEIRIDISGFEASVQEFLKKSKTYPVSYSSVGKRSPLKYGTP